MTVVCCGCWLVQLLYAETPSNPLMTVLDVDAFARLGCHRRHHHDRTGDADIDADDCCMDGVDDAERLTVVDATFASPHLLKPINFGVDVVIHSAYVVDSS